MTRTCWNRQLEIIGVGNSCLVAWKVNFSVESFSHCLAIVNNDIAILIDYRDEKWERCLPRDIGRATICDNQNLQLNFNFVVINFASSVNLSKRSIEINVRDIATCTRFKTRQLSWVFKDTGGRT